ncbi:unnamed protein product, partial [Meganyctiphanes norvegica]
RSHGNGSVLSTLNSEEGRSGLKKLECIDVFLVVYKSLVKYRKRLAAAATAAVVTAAATSTPTEALTKPTSATETTSTVPSAPAKMSGFLKNIKAAFGDVEQAPYTIVKEHEKYEERHYPARKWASTKMKSISRDETISPMFRSLFNYISGKNEQNIRVEMTTPVTTHVEPGAGPTCESSFVMSFLVPDFHQESPPTPFKPVYTTERPAMNVLTRRFGGYVTDQIIIDEAKALSEDIQKNGEENVDFEHFYLAGYDPPYKIMYRRNEIWFVKKVVTDNKENGTTQQINDVKNENIVNASTDQENNKINDEKLENNSNVENKTQNADLSEDMKIVEEELKNMGVDNQNLS